MEPRIIVKHLKLIYSRPSRLNRENVMNALAYLFLTIFTLINIFGAAILISNGYERISYLLIPSMLVVYKFVYDLMWNDK